MQMNHLNGLLCGVLIVWLASPALGAIPPAYSIKHEPDQPRSKQAVRISLLFRWSPPFDVKLHLQAVPPGEYIRRSDPEYKEKWVELPMRSTDSPRQGHYVEIPGEKIKHRWLYRYRISYAGVDGKRIFLPGPTDPYRNYAFFCYDGLPAWTGSREPGKAPARTFSSEFLATIPPIHLIAHGEEVASSQWNPGAHRKRFEGTLIRDGVIYDHIQFHSRGQGSAHISGKNKWGLKFDADVPSDTNDVHALRLRACCDIDLNPGQHTPYIPVHRGIGGLDEAVTFRAYQLAGVPSSSTRWIHFRVIDSATEAAEKDQYDGDLWGLYLGVADIDKGLLRNQELPDGLLVSIQSGIKHLPDDKSAGQAEWDQFLAGMRSSPQEDWWRKNLHLPSYYSFHALNRLLGNVDIRPDGNHGYYRHPDGRWRPIPWDNDMCFVPRHHQPGHIEAVRCLDHPRLKREYQNRAREILDLFAADASPTGGQIGQLIAELAAVLSPPKFETNWAQLDEAMWNAHPRFNQKGTYFVNPAYGDHFGGRWERKLTTNDIRGFEKYLVEFCTDSRPVKNYAPNDGNPLGYGWGYVAHEARDEKIPPRPSIAREAATARTKRGFRVSNEGLDNELKIEWRVGRVGPGKFEFEEHFRLLPSPYDRQIRVLDDVFQEKGTYRIRARLHDTEGRASHWSEPIVEVVE